MRVIFLQAVPRVGRKNEVKEVNDGYALNFLLPRKLAELATEKAVANLELRNKELVIQKEIQEDLLIKNMEELKGKIVTIEGRANQKGSLFSAIHKKEIIQALSLMHTADIGEEYIVLEKPIKEIGDYEIPIEIDRKKSSFKLIVKAA